MQRAAQAAKPTVVEEQRSALLQMTRLLDMTGDAVMVRDLAGVLTYWNQGAARQYGWEPEEAIGSPVAALLGTKFPAPLAQLESELVRTGHWEGLLYQRRRNGRDLAVESHWEVFCDEQGHPCAVLQVDRAVPSQETGLDPAYAVQRAEVLGDILQNLATTFVFLDTNWIYRMVTNQTATMLGQTVDQMLGRHFLEVFPGAQAEMDRMHQAVCIEGRTLTNLSSHVPIQLADGTVRDTYWDYTVRPVHDRHGVLLGFTSIGFEVTERVALERAIAHRTEDLERANRELNASDRYKDEFLSVISHELKTPLNFIMGFASILGDEVNGPLNDQQRLEVQRIQEGSVRLLELINDLLDMGQMAADKFQLTLSEEPFGDLVHEALLQLRPLAEHRRQQLDADVRVAKPLTVDRRRILQVCSNLVGNAIRFTPEGGRILVRATQQTRGIRVEVFDTGPGIAPEDVDKVFTLFKQLDMSPTRRVGGTGLGLCISKALVEAHGGRIGVDSKPGEGSCFWFELPDAGS